MYSNASSVQQYLEELPADRQPVMKALFEAMKAAFPPGFEATVGYGMIGFTVPHRIYPAGYHCNPKDPLPFAGLASQKNHISFYHMGVYADPALLEWFQKAYAERVPGKLNMGKSCVRFSNPAKVPIDLLAELCSKMTVNDWIALYEKQLKR